MHQSTQKARGMAMLVFVNVMWGLSFIFSKTALSEGMPPMTLAFLRYLITAGLMLPLCLMGITVYFFFEHSGLQRTTASAASLIVSLVPMMTLLFRVCFCRERISLTRWMAVVL